MSEANKNVVRRLFEEVWNKGNLPVADELFASTYAHHDPSTPDVGRGPESEKKRATLYRTAFPDLRLTIEDLIPERLRSRVAEARAERDHDREREEQKRQRRRGAQRPNPNALLPGERFPRLRA